MAYFDVGQFYTNTKGASPGYWCTVEYDSITRSGTTVTMNNAKLVLTRNYIVDCTDGFGVYKYDDIKWFYLYRHRVNFAEAERAIIIRTKNNKQYSIAKIAPSKAKNEEQEKIFNELANRCKDVLIGFTKENQKEYKEFIKNNK